MGRPWPNGTNMTFWRSRGTLCSRPETSARSSSSRTRPWLVAQRAGLQVQQGAHVLGFVGRLDVQERRIDDGQPLVAHRCPSEIALLVGDHLRPPATSGEGPREPDRSAGLA